MATRGQLVNEDGYGASTAQTPGTDFTRGLSDALLVTAAGNASVILADGSTVALTGVAAGQIIRLRAIQVVNTPPTATIVPLYW